MLRIKVYQSFYENWQIEHLDPAFVPYDCRVHPHPQLYETYWILRLYESAGQRDCDYFGLFSWRYLSKTRIPGSKFIEFVKKNSGFDVYFINPFPLLAYLFFNIWDEGELCHPGLVNLSQSLMARAKYPISISEMSRNDHNSLLYCNYWVGNTTFWDTYMSFIQPLLSCCTNWDKNEGPNPYFGPTMYEGRREPFFPFIFERLFSTLLLINEDIAVCPFSRTFEEIIAACDNSGMRQFMNRFGPAIDEIDRQFRFRPSDAKEHRALFQAVERLRDRNHIQL
jgi:hypothetical protein